MSSPRKEALLTIWYIIKSIPRFLVALVLFPFFAAKAIIGNIYDATKEFGGIFLMLVGAFSSLLYTAIVGKSPSKEL